MTRETSQTKIQGTFYPLQHEEWLRACRQLTPAQRDVLYYLRTLDPYGNGLNISIAKIARDFSTPDKEVHRSTVSRALKILEEKGFINLEMIQIQVKVLPKGLHCDNPHCADDNPQSNEDVLSKTSTQSTSQPDVDSNSVSLPPDNVVAYRQQARSPRNKRDRHATSVITTQQARSPRNKRNPKPSPAKNSKKPKNKIEKQNPLEQQTKLAVDYEKVEQVLEQLRQIQCTPSIEINQSVYDTVAKHLENAIDAIAYLKQCLKTWDGRKNWNWTGVFIKAIREGQKPDSSLSQSQPAASLTPTPPLVEREKLSILKAEWAFYTPGSGGRASIIEEIAAHPEWGIEIGDDGPQWRPSESSLMSCAVT